MILCALVDSIPKDSNRQNFSDLSSLENQTGVLHDPREVLKLDL